MQISVIFCVSKFRKNGRNCGSIERSKAKSVSALGGVACPGGRTDAVARHVSFSQFLFCRKNDIPVKFYSLHHFFSFSLNFIFKSYFYTVGEISLRFLFGLFYFQL